MMPNTRHSHFNMSRRRMIKPIIKAKIQRLHKRIIAQYLVRQCDSQERVWTMRSETPECHLLVTGDWATHLISLRFCFPICQVGITTLARVILRPLHILFHSTCLMGTQWTVAFSCLCIWVTEKRQEHTVSIFWVDGMDSKLLMAAGSPSRNQDCRVEKTKWGHVHLLKCHIPHPQKISHSDLVNSEKKNMFRTLFQAIQEWSTHSVSVSTSVLLDLNSLV